MRMIKAVCFFAMGLVASATEPRTQEVVNSFQGPLPGDVLATIIQSDVGAHVPKVTPLPQKICTKGQKSLLVTTLEYESCIVAISNLGSLHLDIEDTNVFPEVSHCDGCDELDVHVPLHLNGSFADSIDVLGTISLKVGRFHTEGNLTAKAQLVNSTFSLLSHINIHADTHGNSWSLSSFTDSVDVGAVVMKSVRLNFTPFKLLNRFLTWVTKKITDFVTGTSEDVRANLNIDIPSIVSQSSLKSLKQLCDIVNGVQAQSDYRLVLFCDAMGHTSVNQ